MYERRRKNFFSFFFLFYFQTDENDRSHFTIAIVLVSSDLLFAFWMSSRWYPRMAFSWSLQFLQADDIFLFLFLSFFYFRLEKLFFSILKNYALFFNIGRKNNNYNSKHRKQ